jgi:Tol biopolymer transport system component
MVEGVARSVNAVQFGISQNGTIAYLSGPAAIGGGQMDLAFINDGGTIEPLPFPTGAYQDPRISPDGTRITFSTDDGREAAVWIYDLKGGTAARRLTLVGRNRFPMWAADGEHVAFQSDREGDSAIFWQRADGVGAAERLTRPGGGELHVPESWMPKSDRFLFDAVKDGTHRSMLFSLTRKTAEPFGGVHSVVPINAVFSPDGRWVAYTVRESLSPSQFTFATIYVQPFPTNGTVYQLTRSENGHFPVWSRDGKRLFYVPGPGRFASIDVVTEPTFAFSNPTPAPMIGFLEGGPTFVRSYDITLDGKRVIGVVSGTTSPGSNPRQANIEVVLNWFEELKARVPVK